MVPIWLGDAIIMGIPQGLSGWRFHTQTLLHSEMHVGLHTKCPLLLSDFNQNWNEVTNSVLYGSEI
jgi:hypothetical protein